MAAVMTASCLQAQEEIPTQSQDSLPKTLDEVVVTATRFPKKISETGKVITVIDRQQLDRSGGKDISQILNEQAGLLVNGSGSNPGKDKSVFLRGSRTAYTVILINGIPVNDPTGIGGAFDLRMLPVEQIERIEILKGAQSTLYGSEAVAGVINIITRKGEGKPATLYGGLMAGNYKTMKAHAGLSGAMQGSNYNISFIHQESKGVPEAKDTQAVKTFPKNGYVQNALSMDFNGRIAKGLHVKPFFRYSYFKGTYSDGAFAPARNRFRASLISAGTQAQYQFKEGSITALYSYDEVTRSFTSSYGTTPYDGNKHTAEVFGHYNLSKHFQALAGFRFDRFDMKQPSSTISDTSTNIASPYLSLFFKDLNGFYLELGTRYNKHSQYGDNFTYSINPSYLIKDRVKLFINYGTAFKAPAISELFGQWGSNPNLKPESSHTIEGGLQTALFADKLDLRVVYFDRTIENVIDYDANFTYINYNKQEDHGFEIEPTLRLSKDLTIKLFYAFVDGRVTTGNGGKDTAYNNLFRRPKHRFGLNAGFQVMENLFVSSNLGYFGKRNDQFYNPTTFSSERIRLKDYTLWDAYAEYVFAKKKLRVFAQVNNILDTDYYEVYGFTTLGTNFTAGFRFRL